MRPISSVKALARSRATGPLRGSAVLLACLGLLAAVTACDPLPGSGAEATSGQVITVAVVPGIENATVELAQHNGLFSHAGINVSIRRFNSVSKELDALSNGAVQIAATDYGDLFFDQATAPSPIYKILADGYDAAPGVAEIMTMPGSPITNPAQIANKTIAAPDTEQVPAPTDAPNSLVVASATSVLQGFGVNLSTLTWHEMSQQQEIYELVHHQVPAILVTGAYVYRAQQAGAVELADGCSGATAGIPLAGYAATKAWASINAQTVAAFRSAIDQADAQASMPGPVQALLPGYAGLTRQEAQLVTTGVYPLSTIAASVQRTADLMSSEGMIGTQINVYSMIVK